MSINTETIINRLNELIKDNSKTKKLPLGKNNKYAVFSDLHLGDGGNADNFSRNEETLSYALNYYKNKGYSIILLGDIEEFWQFDLNMIRKRYDNSIYNLLSSFPNNTVHRVSGNHDIEWAGLPDPIKKNSKQTPLVPEAILFSKDIFLIHGHQGDELSDKKAWSSRYWVRVFKKFEPIARKFGYENYSATKSQVPKDRERVYYTWAKDNKMFLVCGHTHRAMFASRVYSDWLRNQIDKRNTELEKYLNDDPKREKLLKIIKKLKKDLKTERKRGRDINPLEANGVPLPCYFNSGSGLYRKGITSIEIEKNKIRLIKWRSDKLISSQKRRMELWKEEKLTELRKKCSHQTV